MKELRGQQHIVALDFSQAQRFRVILPAGSPEAVRRGCACPILDNVDMGPGTVISELCKMHNSPKMRAVEEGTYGRGD